MTDQVSINRTHGVLCACNRATIPYACAEDLDLFVVERDGVRKVFHGFDDCSGMNRIKPCGAYAAIDDGQRTGAINLNNQTPERL